MKRHVLLYLLLVAVLPMVAGCEKEPAVPAGGASGGAASKPASSGQVPKADHPASGPATKPAAALVRSLRVKTVWTGRHDPAVESTVTLGLDRGWNEKKLRRRGVTDEKGEVSLEFPAAWKRLTVVAENSAGPSNYRIFDSTSTDTLQITLQKGGTVFGFVRLEGSREPVAGAEVWAAGSSKRMKSGPDGSFEFTGVGQDPHLGARKGKYVTAARPRSEQITVEPGSRVGPIDLLLKPGVTAHGTVTDSETKKPIAGIWVNFVPWHRTLRSSRTDAQGRYRIEGLPEGNCNIAVREESGYRGNRMLALGKTAEEQVDLAVVRPTVVFGRVLNAGDKQPIPYASVMDRSRPGGPIRSAIADEQGNYELELTGQGEAAIFACSDELVSTTKGEVEPRKIERAKRNGPIDLLLVPGLVLSGTVRDQTTGNAVPDATLTFHLNGLNTQTVSDKEGNYAFRNLIAGTGNLNVSSPEHVQFHAETTIEEQKRNELDVALVRGAIVFGRVLLETDRSAVAGASVTVQGVGRVASKADGSFEIKRIPPGKVQLEAQKGELVSAVDLSEMPKIEVAAGQRSGPHELKLKPGLTVTGMVANSKTKQPIAGARIEAYTSWGQNEVSSDALGFFEIRGLGARLLTVNASAEGYLSASQEVQVAKNTPNTVEFSLEPAATVFGHVWIEKNGTAADGARVTLRVGNTSSVGTANADGSYEITMAMVEGEGTLTASKAPYVSSLTSEGLKVPLKEGQRNGPYDLILQRGLAVSGTVTDSETHQPIAGATVQRTNGDNDAKTKTDPSGKYRLEGFSAEEVWLEAFSRDHVGQRQRLKISAASETLCNFALERGGDVEVHVVDEQQQPQVGAHLHLSYSGPRAQDMNVQNQQTDGKGIYIFHGVSRTTESQVMASVSPNNGSVAPLSGTARVSFAPGTMRTSVTVVVKGSGQEEQTEENQHNTLAGRVTDATGRGLPGVRIQMGGPEQLESHLDGTRSKAGGEYVLTLPYSPRPERQSVTAWLNGYAINTKSAVFGTKERPGVLDFVMEPEHYLDVTVVDSQNKPVADARIMVQLQRGSFWLTAPEETDGQGKVRVGMLPEGYFSINANARDGRHGTAESEADRAVTVTLGDFGKIHGRVVDALSNRPISRFSVSRNGQPISYSEPTGEFVIEKVQLNIGSERLQIKADGYGPLQVDAQIVELNSTAVEEFKLSSAELCSGVVVDARTSARISGAVIIHYFPYSQQDRSVQWQYLDPMRSEQKLTGADGSFMFAEGTEKGVLMIRAAGYERRVIWPGERPPSSPMQPMPIALNKGASIEGKFVAPPHLTLNYAHLDLKERRNYSYVFENGRMTQPNTFRWESLGAGTYLINLSYNVAQGSNGDIKKEVTLQAGQDLKIDINAPQGTSTLFGLVTMDGKPAPGVDLHLSGNDVSRTTNSDDRGNYWFDQLSDGAYRVTLTLPLGGGAYGSYAETKTVTRDVAVKGSTKHDIALLGPKKVRAILMLPTDPAPGRWKMDQVVLERDMSTAPGPFEDRRGASSIRNGEVEFTGYFNGTYKVGLRYTATNGQPWQLPLGSFGLNNLVTDQDLGGLAVPQLAMVNLRLTSTETLPSEVRCDIAPVGIDSSMISSGVEGQRVPGRWSALMQPGEMLLGPVMAGNVEIRLSGEGCTLTPAYTAGNLQPGQILALAASAAAGK